MKASNQQQAGNNKKSKGFPSKKQPSKGEFHDPQKKEHRENGKDQGDRDKKSHYANELYEETLPPETRLD